MTAEIMSYTATVPIAGPQLPAKTSLASALNV